MVYAKKAICGHLNEKEVLSFETRLGILVVCLWPQKPTQEKLYAC